MQKTETIPLDFLRYKYLTYFQPWKYFLKNDGWKIYSGSWELKSTNTIHYTINPNVKTGENFSVWSEERWQDYKFNVEFRISTPSIKPPEGGAILYFHFRNPKNFYSFHFCPSKHKIEMIKRFRGQWSVLGEGYCDLKIGQEYSVIITTKQDYHRCSLNGINLLESQDDKIGDGMIGIGAKYCEIEYREPFIQFL